MGAAAGTQRGRPGPHGLSGLVFGADDGRGRIRSRVVACVCACDAAASTGELGHVPIHRRCPRVGSGQNLQRDASKGKGSCLCGRAWCGFWVHSLCGNCSCYSKTARGWADRARWCFNDVVRRLHFTVVDCSVVDTRPVSSHGPHLTIFDGSVRRRFGGVDMPNSRDEKIWGGRGASGIGNLDADSNCLLPRVLARSQKSLVGQRKETVMGMSMASVRSRFVARVLGERGRRWFSVLQILREYWFDIKDYVGSAAYRRTADLDVEQLNRDLTFSYHQVEKALAFPQPKRPFGATARKSLVQLTARSDLATVDSTVLDSARRARQALDSWNRHGVVDLISAPLREGSGNEKGPITDRFFLGRSSCRNYDPSTRLSADDVASLVSVAQSTPSVCNRQAARVHALLSPDAVAKALSLQNGNRGFGHTVPHLLVVTVDRRAFKGSLERNQRWVDGALFAMTIVWVAESRGLATCMLNWSMGITANRKLRAAIELSPHEDVICMIAIGYPAAAPVHRARSARRETSSILRIH